MPFVVQNANAAQLDAIFWIEKVVNPIGGDEPFIQLQYVQRVILDFLNIHWPHISVATLVKTL
jgi:CMP-2-keto-3-deoxyoctulosonic acid synthetase